MAKKIKGRKFVATAATAALVASAIVPVASASGFADQSKISSWAADAVAHAVEKGYMNGVDGNNFNPQGTVTRAQVAQVVFNALGLDAVEGGDFKDVPASAWYATAVNTLAANGIVSGTGNGTFSPDKTLTLAEAAVILANALGLEGEADLSKFADAKDVPTWANSAVQALVANGYIKGGTKNGQPVLDILSSLTRERLATLFVAVAKDTIEEGVVTEEPVVTDEETVTGEVVVKDLTVIGAKKLELTFENAVDAAKAKVAVKKGSVNVNIDGFEFSEDKKSVVITTTTKLSKGDYTVTVSGLTEKEVSKTVTAADEKITKINVLSTTAPMNAAATTIDSVSYAANQTAFVNYEVLNQYGEAVNASGITWTQSTGGKIADNTTTKTLTIGNTSAAGVNFIPGAKVYLTGVYGPTATVVNAEVTIGLPSQVSSVEVAGVYDTTTSKLVDLPAGFVDNRYVLLFQAKDQYGNVMSISNLSALTLLSDNPLFVKQPTTQATDVTIGSTTYNAIKLEAGAQVAKGGTANLQLISNNTGSVAKYTITAEALSTVTAFQMSAPSDLIAGGEKVEVPFTAVDQYGNAVTKYSSLVGVNLNATAGTLRFEQQKDGSAKLYYIADANTTNYDAIVSLTSTLTTNGNYSNVQVSVKPDAVPTTVVGLDSDVVESTSIAKGASLSFDYSALVVQDQYGRTIDAEDIEAWLDATVSDGDNAIVLESNANATTPFIVTSTNTTSDAALVYITNSTDEFTVAARTGATSSANETLKFSLSTASTPAAVTTSSKSVQFTSVAQNAFVSYELAELGTMYNDANASATTDSKYNKKVKVYGITEAGAKVLLPTSLFTVSVAGSKLTTSGNTISDVATGGFSTSDFTEVITQAAKTQTVKVTVLVNDSVGAAAAVLNQDLVVTNATPVANTFKTTSAVSNGSAFVSATASGDVATVTLKGFISKVVDQYGVELTGLTPTITVSGVVKGDSSSFAVTGNATTGAAITGAKPGDKFTVTYTYAGGKTLSINFIVAAN